MNIFDSIPKHPYQRIQTFRHQAARDRACYDGGSKARNHISIISRKSGSYFNILQFFNIGDQEPHMVIECEYNSETDQMTGLQMLTLRAESIAPLFNATIGKESN